MNTDHDRNNLHDASLEELENEVNAPSKLIDFILSKSSAYKNKPKLLQRLQKPNHIPQKELLAFIEQQNFNARIALNLSTFISVDDMVNIDELLEFINIWQKESSYLEKKTTLSLKRYIKKTEDYLQDLYNNLPEDTFIMDEAWLAEQTLLQSEKSPKKKNLTQKQKNIIQKEINVAKKAFEERKFSDAIECYTRILSIHPNNILALEGRIESYSELNDFSNALSDCELFDKFNRKQATVFRAKIYLKQGNVPEALSLFDQVINHLSAELCIEISQKYIFLNNLEKAQQYCMHVLSLDKNENNRRIQVEAKEQLNQIGQLALNTQKIEIAKSCYLYIAELPTPLGAYAMFKLGIIEARYGNYTDALNYFIRTQNSPYFEYFEQLLQLQTTFGIKLAELKLNIAVDPPYWQKIIPNLIIVTTNATSSGSSKSLFLLGNPPKQYLKIIQPFLREKELSKNCTPLFEQLNDSLVNNMINSVNWNTLLPDQLNKAYPHNSPDVQRSGLHALISSDYGILLLCAKKELRDKITTEGLDTIFYKKDQSEGLSTLCSLFSSPLLLKMLQQDTLLCDKISTEGLNACYKINEQEEILPLTLLASQSEGLELLKCNTNLRNKITHTGLLNAIKYLEKENINDGLDWLKNELKRFSKEQDLSSKPQKIISSLEQPFHKELECAKQAINDNKIIDAIEAYNRILEVNPQYALALEGRAQLNTQLEIEYNACIDQLSNTPNDVKTFESLHLLGQYAILNENLTIAINSYTYLSKYNGLVGVNGKYNLGILEASHGDYKKALKNFIQLPLNRFSSSLQARIKFGIALCYKKCGNLNLWNNILIEIEEIIPGSHSFLSKHIIALPITNEKISAKNKIFIIGYPQENIISLIQPFFRDEEFTPNCITLFENLDEQLCENIPWTTLTSEQLNEVVITHQTSGLMALLQNPCGHKIFFETLYLQKLVTKKGLTEEMLDKNGNKCSVEMYLNTIPEGREFMKRFRAPSTKPSEHGIFKQDNSPKGIEQMQDLQSSYTG